MARKCRFKKHGGGAACSCGIAGKKYLRVPLAYQDALFPVPARVLSTARKWAKKKGLRTLEKVKEKFEGVDDMEDETTNIDGENWFPVNFCFLVPKEGKKFKEYEHQTGGVCCQHHKIRGEIVEIPLKPCEERMLNKLFSRLNIVTQHHLPYYRVVPRVISYLKLPVAPVESRVPRTRKKERNDAIAMEIALGEAMGASKDVSHEAWQWVDVVDGNFDRVPALRQYQGQTILMIYPNSD